MLLKSYDFGSDLQNKAVKVIIKQVNKRKPPIATIMKNCMLVRFSSIYSLVFDSDVGLLVEVGVMIIGSYPSATTFPSVIIIF